jgi:hypothetical protein
LQAGLHALASPPTMLSAAPAALHCLASFELRLREDSRSVINSEY